MVGETFVDAVLDSDEAIRNVKGVPTHQRVDPTSILRTQSQDVFESIMQSCYQAAVLVTSKREKDAMRAAFAFTRDTLSVNSLSHASIDSEGIVSLDIQPKAQTALNPVENVLENVASGFHRMTGIAGIEIEVNKGFALDTHRHPYPTLNFVLYDSATGWHDTDNQPGNAGEGNIFFFKGGFYHESTTRQQSAKPQDRVSVIVRPDTAHMNELAKDISLVN